MRAGMGETIDFNGVPVRQDEPLASYSTMHVGGSADYMCAPRSDAELCAVLGYCSEQGIPIKIIGAGSNILFADAGFRGCIITMRDYEPELFEVNETCVTVSAGMHNSAFVKKCADNGLGGIEFLALIPGSIGGALAMNAGCKNYFTKKYEECMQFVQYIDIIHNTRKQRVFACDVSYGYRTSSLKGEIIVAACFLLLPKEKDVILEELLHNRNIKNKTIPFDHNTLGSIFKNPAGDLSAGQLIDQAGLKGMRIGSAVISERHANIITVDKNGSAADVAALIAAVRERVFQQYAIALECEIEYIGET